MGFHDHLYPSSYYNEEELLSSDEYPPPLVNICAKYCVNHLSKTLLEKKKVGGVVVEGKSVVNSDEEEGDDDDGNESSSGGGGSGCEGDEKKGQGAGGRRRRHHHHHHRGHHHHGHGTTELKTEYRLRAGVRLPSELSEKIFSYLDKHTSSAELRGGDGGSSSSSSSSSGDSSSGGAERAVVLSSSSSSSSGGGGGSSSSSGDDDEGGGGAHPMEVDGREHNNVLRRRVRRRRRRRVGVVVVGDDGEGGGEAIGGGNPRRRRRRVLGGRKQSEITGNSGGGSGGGRRRKRRMLWNGGVVDEEGRSSVGYGGGEDNNGGGDEQVVRVFEIVGFDDVVGPLFRDPTNLPLTKLNLRTSTAVTDSLLATLLSHQPKELDIHECSNLTVGCLQSINGNSSNLLSLSIGRSTQVLPQSGGGEGPILNCPKLMRLVVWNLRNISGGAGYWGRLTASFRHCLAVLDLSGCGEFEDFEFLRGFRGLRRLVLYNVVIKSGGDHEEEREEEHAPVLYLKDEEEGMRLDNNGVVVGEGGVVVVTSEYVQYRRRLERLVNKLLGPVCGLKELRHLDISTSSDPSTSSSLIAPSSSPSNTIGSVPPTPWSTYPNPNQVLSTIVQNLPKLTHLDISGTNLAGRGVAVLMEQQEQQLRVGGALLEDDVGGANSNKLCDIPGLNSRVDNPLEFLGLYGTAHDASHRHCIPAKRVSGDKDEGQVLVACEAYLHRHEVLEKVLNDLFHLFRSEKGTHITRSLRLILRAMNLHPTEKHVQISGSASLFYIVKNEQHNNSGSSGAGSSGGDEVINPPMRRMILSTIVNAMAIHKVDSTMARNGCLTICHFRIPQDVMFIYAKLVKILLKILGQSILGPQQRHESFVERIAIYLLNSLACQVEGWHKRLVGDLGAMKRMLQLIRDRLSRLECDDVMEIAWSTMWNVTDETPENCEKFLKNDGMVLFLKCLHTFPNKPELLRNMMGLLGNVAEVGALRKQLMTSVFISVFCKLLDSTQDNIEVSYNAAGVLAHMLSDGETAWGITIPSRSVIQESMVRNVNRWNINSKRNINYRSFEPILRLLRVSHTVECQLWASWALANLTRVYPEKYVPLVEKERGLAPLNDLLNDSLLLPTPSTSSSSSNQPLTIIQQDVKKYASITIQNVNEYNKKGKIDLGSFMDG